MTQSIIRDRLVDTLEGITSLPRIVYEGENFKPTTSNDYPFIRFTFLPAESIQGDLTASQTSSRGLARIDVFCSRTSNSASEARALAETIIAAYPASLTLVETVQLTIEQAWFEQTNQEATAISIPVFVRWNAIF